MKITIKITLRKYLKNTLSFLKLNKKTIIHIFLFIWGVITGRILPQWEEMRLVMEAGRPYVIIYFLFGVIAVFLILTEQIGEKKVKEFLKDHLWWWLAPILILYTLVIFFIILDQIIMPPITVWKP